MFSWLRKQNRVAANPFELVSKVDARGKESFYRRALNDDEVRKLLAVPRRPLYLLALHTGLRRGEINALRWGDLHLDVTNPFYVVPVAKSKSRKEQPRPLHYELVRELQAMKSAGKVTPDTLVFPEQVPAMKVIRAGFKTAGIPLVDERGHRVDFHALRMTYITRLQRAGVSPREAMQLPRHSDMRLTMKTYTDAAAWSGGKSRSKSRPRAKWLHSCPAGLKAPRPSSANSKLPLRNTARRTSSHDCRLNYVSPAGQTSDAAHAGCS
jgi:integrase